MIRAGGDRLQRGEVNHFGRDRSTGARRFLNRGPSWLKPLRVAANQDNVGAERGELARGFKAEAAVGAGHDAGSSAQISLDRAEQAERLARAPANP